MAIRSETIVQWFDRFEAPLAELEIARDGLAAYTEEELTSLWKQTFADNICGEEIQIITTHMPRYVDANSLRDVIDYLDGTFDTQLFRSLCVDIARFLPNRYVPDKRTMQGNRDRFERKQLLQVFGEPDYDSPLMSASKTKQKRKSSPATVKDRSDKKRVKSVRKTSSAPKSKIIPQNKQCKRAGCVNRGTSATHTHAQCFYKTAEKKGASPTTNLLAKKENTAFNSKTNTLNTSNGKPPAQHASQSSLPQDPFQLSHEKIPVKSIVGRVGKRDTTPVIALATPRGNPSCIKQTISIALSQASFLACSDSSRDSNHGNIQSVRLSQLLNAWLQRT